MFTKWPSLAIPSVHGIRGPRERKPYQAVSTKVGEGQKVLFQRASPSAQVQFRWAVSKLFTNITFKMAEWKQGLFGCCGNCGNCEYFGPFLKSLRELTYFMENYYRLLREFLLPLCGLQGCWGFEQEWMSLRLHFLLFSLHPHFSLTWRSPRKIWHRGNDQNTYLGLANQSNAVIQSCNLQGSTAGDAMCAFCCNRCVQCQIGNEIEERGDRS